MFVRKINIKEFRGIKKCSNPIELSSFTVLIGKNNSGKSTILEALSLLPMATIEEFFTGETKIEFLRHLHRSKEKYQYDTTTGPPIESNESLIYLYTGTSEIEYLNVDNKNFTLLIKEKEIDCKAEGIDKIDFLLKSLPDFFHIKNKKSLSSSVVFVPNDTEIIRKMEKKMQLLKNLIIKNGSHVKVAKIINNCVDDEYSDINFSEPITIRKVLPDNNVYIEIRDLGDGAEKIIKLMTLIDVIDPELVLIDDFESGLHPSLIKVFLNWLKEKKWQKVISTHSIDVLYHLVDIEPNDTKILLLSKSNKDVLSCKSLTLDEIEDIFNANNDPRLVGNILNL